MDGTAFLAAYRLLPAEQAPVIVYSAHYTEHQALQHLGASAFLQKPFDLPELLNTIARLVR